MKPDINFVMKEKDLMENKPKAREEESIDFSSFLFSVSSAALIAMGEMPDPENETQATPDLALAKQNIDILQLIQQKTLGNLDPDEKRLLDGLLYNLRTKFIECREKLKK
jgi:hypothetical protein